MRLFFSKHELKLRRKRTIAAIICVVVVLGVYWILTRPQKAEPEMPTVIVEPVVKDDVEIYGEYVGRINSSSKYVPVWKAIWRICFLPKVRM